MRVSFFCTFSCESHSPRWNPESLWIWRDFHSEKGGQACWLTSFDDVGWTSSTGYNITLSHFTMETQPSFGQNVGSLCFSLGWKFLFFNIHRGWLARELEVYSSVWDDFLGRLLIGRIYSDSITTGRLMVFIQFPSLLASFPMIECREISETPENVGKRLRSLWGQ